MSIVNRLKDYIQAKQIPVTQFADTCEIPRPTMSQLLNGRNKKVSDELIRKIHASYPDLSVLWLMFGEGPMYAGTTISKTTPSVPERLASANQQKDIQRTRLENEKSSLFEPGHSILFDFPNSDSAIENEMEAEDNREMSNRNSDDDKTDDASETEDRQDANVNSIRLSTASDKRIVSIIVYYSDNSFESFGPLMNQ